MTFRSVQAVKIITPFIFLVIFSVTIFTQTHVNTISELRALTPGSAAEVSVAGYYSNADGGGGMFIWDANSRTDDNGGTVISPNANPSQGRWKRDYSSYDHINIRWFGARGEDNPMHDDRIPIAASIEYAISSGLYKVFIPVGVYQVSGQIELGAAHSGLVIEGELNFKTSDYYSGEIRNEPRNIFFKFTKNDFRIVDEDRSSVIKLRDNASHNQNSLYLLYIRPRNNELLSGLKIRNIALNGNKYNNGLWPDFSRSQRLLYIVYHDGIIENVQIENIAAYSSLMTGIDIARSGVEIAKKLLAYDNEMHGIATREKVDLNDVETHGNGFAGFLNTFHGINESPGGYGIDFAGGSEGIINGFTIHHNWAGMKTANSKMAHLFNGTFNKNWYHGFTTQHHSTAPEVNLVIDNVQATQNGGAGIRIAHGTDIYLGNILVKNNGWSDHHGVWGNIAIYKECAIDTLVVSDYAVSSHANFSGRLSGNISINHLQVLNNEKPGLLLNDEVTVKSGKILNNKDVGIEISSNSIAQLYNISFGDTQQNPTQTSYEIFGGDNSTLYHSGLDFTDSQVSDNNQIRADNVHEVANATLFTPGEGAEYIEADPIEFTARAAAPNVHLLRIEFYANGELIGEILNSALTFVWNDAGPGQYTIQAVAVFDDNSTESSDEVSIVILPQGSQSIILNPGWNTISAYIEPRDTDLSVVFGEIKDNINIVSNNAGNVFWPEYGINEIGEWNSLEGYSVFMHEADTLTVSGHQLLPEETSVTLVRGWNKTAYLHENPLPVRTALENIEHNVELVANNSGDIYWPAYDVNSLGYMEPGQGYRIFMNETIELYYPSSAEVQPRIAGTGEIKSAESGNQQTPKHYKVKHRNTGSSAILLVESNDFENNDEIGVWTRNGDLVGSGIVINGRAPVTVWGKNEFTGELTSGAEQREELYLTHWSALEDKQTTLTIHELTTLSGIMQGEGTLYYDNNSVVIASVGMNTDTPLNYSLEQNYPNPFNPTTTIQYRIPRDESVTLKVYNLLGQKVKTLVDEQQRAGSYEIEFRADNLASGVYFYRLIAGNYTEIKRMILIK